MEFGKANFKDIGLRKAIDLRLDEIALEYDFSLQSESISDKFSEIIKTLSKTEKVVILIDEYHKPIIEYLEPDKIAQAAENRGILKAFYSVIKGCDAYLQFVFLTGVSKFSKVSIFSDLNNLYDLALHPLYSQMLGYTQAELENILWKELNKLPKRKTLMSNKHSTKSDFGTTVTIGQVWKMCITLFRF